MSDIGAFDDPQPNRWWLWKRVGFSALRFTCFAVTGLARVRATTLQSSRVVLFVLGLALSLLGAGCTEKVEAPQLLVSAADDKVARSYLDLLRFRKMETAVALLDPKM